MNRATPKKVFLVEDHPIFRDGLISIMKQKTKGELVACGSADNAGSALEEIKELKPDVILVDISIKGPDGIELTKMIRTQYPDLPILLLSMHDESIYAERAFRAGANGYIMKQEPADNIINAIQTVLRGEMFASSKIMNKILRKTAHKKIETDTFPENILSDRELEVFRLLGEGRSTRQIAEGLHLSTKTIGTYCEHIKEKLDLKNSHVLIQHAVQWLNNQFSG